MRGVLQVALGLLATAPSCGGSHSNASRPDPEGGLVVHDRGAEPRQLLRYELGSRVIEDMEVGIDLQTRMSFTNTVLETGHATADVPAITSRCRLAIDRQLPSGDVVVSAQVNGVDVAKEGGDVSGRQLAAKAVLSMNGSRGTWRLLPSGRVLDSVL